MEKTSKIYIAGHRGLVGSAIVNNLSNMDVTQFWSDPSNIYKDEYEELANFRKKFFNHFNVTVDVNKFIRANEKVYNQSLLEAVEKLIKNVLFSRWCVFLIFCPF